MQVPRGKHYLIDVIAGAVVGVAAGAIVDRVATIAEPRSALTQVDPR